MHNLYLRQSRRALLLTLPVFLSLTSAWGQRIDRARAVRLLRQPHAEAQFIVKFREVPDMDSVAPYSRGGVRGLQRIGHGQFHLLETDSGGQDVLTSLSEHPEIEYIEPNYVISVEKTPNDSLFPQQWGLKNTATVGADTAATAAWDYTTGSRKTVVAVIDTGVDFNHPDLTANIWRAPRPFTFNGTSGVVTCPAGSRGVNAITSTCEPMDDNGHGTHCAGIIGASGDNAAGVAGVNWVASILPVKSMGSKGTGLLSDVLRAMDAVVQIKKQFGAEANVRVISASWGFTGNSQALEAALAAVNAADILFVAAAGNAAANNDTTANFPANSTQPNVVSVAATDKSDALATFSNYGIKVHLGAPGVSIASTYLNGQYVMMNGTSMATPFVAGAASLLLANCTANTAVLREHLLTSVDAIPALTGKTATGGRLNIYKALRRCAVPVATLSATPASQRLTAGGSTTYSLLPGGDGGVSGGGTIAFTGLPAGVTAKLTGPVTLGSPVAVNIASTNATLPGTYKLTATLTASGYKANVPLTLIVDRAPAFTMSAAAPAMPLEAGKPGTIAVRITRNAGFTGPVSVTVQALPAGVTAAPVTIASGQTAANVVLNVSAAAASGTAKLSLSATGGTPATTVTAPVTVTVTATARLTMAFKSPQVSVKAGTAASMEFTIVASTAPTTLQFTLSGMPTAAPVQIMPVSAGLFRLVINTPATWAGRTAQLKLTLAANALTSSSTASLTVTP